MSKIIVKMGSRAALAILALAALGCSNGGGGGSGITPPPPSDTVSAPVLSTVTVDSIGVIAGASSLTAVASFTCTPGGGLGHTLLSGRGTLVSVFDGWRYTPQVRDTTTARIRTVCSRKGKQDSLDVTLPIRVASARWVTHEFFAELSVTERIELPVEVAGPVDSVGLAIVRDSSTSTYKADYLGAPQTGTGDRFDTRNALGPAIILGNRMPNDSARYVAHRVHITYHGSNWIAADLTDTAVIHVTAPAPQGITVTMGACNGSFRTVLLHSPSGAVLPAAPKYAGTILSYTESFAGGNTNRGVIPVGYISSTDAGVDIGSPFPFHYKFHLINDGPGGGSGPDAEGEFVPCPRP